MPATHELLQEGRYRIDQPAPRDAVFEAYDTVRNTKVLVREFPVRLNPVMTVSQQESIKLAFATQAKVLSEIEHESLPHVHDYFSEIDRQYLVMESVDGENLYELLFRNRKPFPVQDVVRWADELLDALNYLHSRKPSIVHRDIRPKNLHRDASGKIKLLGLGVDNSLSSDEATPIQTDPSELGYSPMEQIWPGLDAASQKVITNSYDSRSERILKEPLDARSDIYSLGATLYFLVTNVEPVDALERSIDVLEGKLDPLREPTKVDPRIPAEISDVLMKALEIKRENRYDSALIMREVLRTAVARVEERAASNPTPATAETVPTPVPIQTPGVDVEKLAAQKIAAEKLAAEKIAAEKLAAEKLAAEKLAADKKRQEEQLQKQLHEAEQQRILSEQRAAADRVRREQEEAKAQAAALAAAKAQESQLVAPASAAEVVAYRDNAAVDENELAAVLEELEKVEREAGDVPQSAAVVAPQPVTSVSVDTPVSAANEELDAASAEEDDTEDVSVAEEAETPAAESGSFPEFLLEDDLFSETEKRGFGLPVPAIAGAIGLLVLVAVGGWFAMSGSPEPVKPAAVQVAQPVEPDPIPTVDPNASTQAQPEVTSLEVVDPSAQQTAAPKAAPTAKPKKADAKTAADKKKSVTVDDLINDN